jgi:hypothetical protein
MERSPVVVIDVGRGGVGGDDGARWRFLHAVREPVKQEALSSVVSLEGAFPCSRAALTH